MNHDQFIGEVQNRAQLSSRGEATRVTRAALETLSERLEPGEADDLAAQLPEEIGRHLETVDDVERFDFDEFVDRVAEKEGLEPDEDGLPAATFHARLVMDLVDDVVTEGEMNDVRDQLPEDYDQLFELVDAEAAPAEAERAEDRTADGEAE